LDAVVGAVLLIACYTDLTRRRIPNSITYPLWALGPVFWLIMGPWYEGLIGLALMFPIHLAFFAIGLDKGGDAKLMIGVGAMFGWKFGLEATLWGVLLMLPVSLMVALAMGLLPSVAKTLVWVARMPFYRAQGLDPGPAPPQTLIPKAPVIAAAVLVAKFTVWAESWLGLAAPAGGAA
jgi:Flp pilus assembly protein protease CpaA